MDIYFLSFIYRLYYEEKKKKKLYIYSSMKNKQIEKLDKARALKWEYKING